MSYSALSEKERHAREMEIMNTSAQALAEQIYDLEQKVKSNQEAATELSWRLNPDRMGGQIDTWI